jgi:two-component system LytT family response regulator
MIVDDEIMAIKTLRVMIDKYITIEKEIRSETNFEKALDKIRQFSPDVLLLDVMMPPYTGFDLLSNISHRNFNVIFTTAYDNYAIQAIKYSALDYLLKPISAEELKGAFDKLISIKETSNMEQYDHLLQNLNKKDSSLFTIAIPTLEKTYFISPKSLIRCESESNYTWFYLENGEKILASKTMKSFEHILLDQNFIRVHRSHLVNKNFIVRVEKADNLLLKDGSLIPLARNKKSTFLEKMK